MGPRALCAVTGASLIYFSSDKPERILTLPFLNLRDRFSNVSSWRQKPSASSSFFKEDELRLHVCALALFNECERMSEFWESGGWVSLRVNARVTK